MLLDAKIVFTFNKLFYDLVRDAKESSADIKAVVKKHYKVKDLTSNANFEAFLGAVPEEVLTAAARPGAGSTLLKTPALTSMEIFKGGVTVGQVAAAGLDANTLASYIYCFILLAHVYDAATKDTSENSNNDADADADGNDSDTEAADTLFEAVMSAISCIQHKQDVTLILDQIIDDDIKNTLVNLKEVMALKVDTPANANASSDTSNSASSSEPMLPPGMEGLANMLEGSKIADLAKEITADIDLSKINVERPEDMLKVITDQNIMGDIIGKVGGKIQQKMQSGEIRQEDFVKEAMGMLGGMKNNPMFANIMKQFNPGEMKKMSTRDRLRKKYEQKQNK